MKKKGKKYTYICLIILILVLIILTFFNTMEFFTSSPMPIYIISLPKHYNERLVPLLNNIQDDPLYNIEEIYAVDGNILKNKNTKYESLKNGQIGCFESHLHFWRKMKSNYGLVLEDDALIDLPGMFKYIQQIIDSSFKDWNIIFLGGRVSYPHICDMNEKISFTDQPDTKDKQYSIIKPNCAIWHAHAYLISEAGCRYLIKKFNNAQNIRLPVDDWMTENDVDGVYICVPEIIPFRYDGISDTII